MNSVGRVATIFDSMAPELPFDETRSPAWEAGIDALPWIRRSDETAYKQGPCPRCGHPLCVVEEARPRARDRPAGEQARFEECNCGVRHPGTPEGRIGCGANGLITRAEGPGQP